MKGDKHLELLYSLLDGLIGQVDRVVTLDEFKAVVEASGAFNRDKDREVYQQMLDQLEKAEVGEDILHDLLIQTKNKDIAERLAVTAFDFIDGKKSLDDIHKIYEGFNEVDKSIKEVEFVTDDLDELYQQTIAAGGIHWRLQSLNRMLGPLRKGDFGFVFARPETGKTTFLASEVSNFAEQVEGPILWFNNEEQGSKVMSRVFQASLGMKLDTLMGNRTHNRGEYHRRTKGLVKIIDDASIHKRQIEDLCARQAPSLIIIDQIDKIKGFTGDRDDLRLGATYQWARELAKSFAPVIGVCQADGTGEGVKWLNMGHVSSAKTSKQAEADFILGIGKSNEQGKEYTRYLNISKNKLQGGPNSNPAERHGFCEVIIDPEIARYKEVGE